MPELLRPMTTGELLDRTFVLYRQHFRLFAGIVIPVPAFHLFMQIVQWVHLGNWGFAVSRSGVGRVLMWSMGVVMLEWIFGLSITHAATVRAVSAVHLARTTTVWESYVALRGRLVRVIVITIMLLLIAVLAAIVGFVVVVAPAILLAAVTGVAMGVTQTAGFQKFGEVAAWIGLVIGTLITMLALARYSLATQACVIEGTTVRASLKRSKVLTKHSLWRIVVVYTLFIVLNLAIWFTLQLSIRFATAPLHLLALTAILQALAQFFAGLVTGPLATVAMSLVYYDERVRKEGFDIDLMMKILDGDPAAVPAT